MSSTKLILFAFLFFTLVSSQTFQSNITSLQDAKDFLLAVQKERAALQQFISQYNADMDAIKSIIVSSVKEDLRWTGLSFGDRWKFQEEGTNSYEALVSRDMTSTNAGTDRRYAMYQGKYVDK